MENKTESFSIKIYGEPILRKKASKVDKIDEHYIDIMNKMLETMRSNDGVGLAAPQIGISKQILVADCGEKENLIKLINPSILKNSGEETAKEGCLSIPGIEIDVTRASSIEVEGLNEKGKSIRIKAEGLLARVLQHEIDHLNGILIVDYASPVSRVFVKRQLKKLRR